MVFITGGSIVLGMFFLMSGLRHLTGYRAMKRYAESMRVPLPGVSVIGTGLVMLFGAFALLFWKVLAISWVTAGLGGLIVFLVVVSFKMHHFWGLRGEKKMENMRYFMGNIALAAALAMVLGFIKTMGL